MNEELSVQEKIIIELQSTKILNIIIDVACEYHLSSKRLVLKKAESLHSKYVRNIIFYLCRSIYGMEISFIVAHTKCPYSTVFSGNEKIRETLNEIGVQTDIINIRKILIETLKV